MEESNTHWDPAVPSRMCGPANNARSAQTDIFEILTHLVGESYRVSGVDARYSAILWNNISALGMAKLPEDLSRQVV